MKMYNRLILLIVILCAIGFSESLLIVDGTTWTSEIAPGKSDTLRIESQGKYVHFSCEMEMKTYGEYETKEDTLILHQKYGEFDQLENTCSCHRAGEALSKYLMMKDGSLKLIFAQNDLHFEPQTTFENDYVMQLLNSD